MQAKLPNFLPNILPNILPHPKPRNPPRYQRVQRGLYRDSRNGNLWHVVRRNGKVVWINLKTPDRDRAMDMIRRSIYPDLQTGNHAVEVLTTDAATGDHFKGKARMPKTPANPAKVPAGQEASDQNEEQHTLRQLLDLWREGKAVSDSTKKRIGFQIKMLEQHLDLNLDVSSLDATRLRRLQVSLREGYKVSTTNDLFAQVIRPALALAVELGWLSKNPAEPVDQLRREETLRLQPSWEQAEKMVSRAEEISAEAGRILRCMLYLGVGQGEIKGLYGEHIDLAKEKVYLLRLKTRRRYEVDIYPHAREFIQSLKKEGLLKTGKPVLEWQNPRHVLERVCRELDLPNYSARALRRTLIIRLIEQGVDLRQIAKWQGHRDAKLILDTYGAYISPERTAAELKKLEDRQEGGARGA